MKIIFQTHDLNHQAKCRRSQEAFSLLEVAIAMAIFFMAIFVILELSMNSLRSAYLLQNKAPDPRVLIGDLVMTNQLEEIVESGDFGDLHPGYVWERAVTSLSNSDMNNGLYKVDVRISLADSQWTSDLTMVLFKPSMASGLTSRSASDRVTNPNAGSGSRSGSRFQTR